MFERIVVPLDGSEPAERALAPALALARRLGACLLLTRVVQAAEPGDRGGRATRLGAIDEAEVAIAEAGEYLEAVRRRLASGHADIAVEVRRGVPAPELVALARPGDLVVMASHGRGLANRWLLGGVAREVTGEAAAAVLLVRHGCTDT